MIGLVNNPAYDLLLGNNIFIQRSELADVVSVNPLLESNSTAVVSSESIERGVTDTLQVSR
jgi:hypothetical protein